MQNSTISQNPKTITVCRTVTTPTDSFEPCYIPVIVTIKDYAIELIKSQPYFK